MNHPTHQAAPPSRRTVLRGAVSLGAVLALSSLPVFEARAAVPRPATATLVPDSQAVALWYGSPATETAIMQQGLPVGNGRIGAMTTGDPAHDAFYLSDATLWTGGANATLGSDGQFPYGSNDFGTFGQLAKAYLSLPAHTSGSIAGYRRLLDLSNGLAVTAYQLGGVTYRREVFASQPDDLLVIRLSQSGGGSYTGSLTLNGTRGEAAGTEFAAALPNGLKYAATVRAVSATGTVAGTGSAVTFSNCQEVLLLISGGTNYAPGAPGFLDPAHDPLATARAVAATAAAATGSTLLATHVADYQRLQQAMTVDLGASSAAQRAMDTPTRLAARAAAGAAPDPELEAGYLQFGRYLMISGSRGSLPVNLQGLWIDTNSPSWMSDYHTDINVQMNYWLPDRAGLSECFTAFADYCVNQFPSWQSTTQKLFNDPRNGFRNTSGKIAGWTVGISTNPWGGSGWWWQPAGSAWLSNSLYEHYEYTLDRSYLARIYPLLKGACEFWQARLLTTTVTDPATGAVRQVLVDDHDWSPEQGPTDAIGITFAQELVWQLFQNYRSAAAALGLDPAFAATVTDLQNRLYLPQVSATTGWLEEWMTDANLGDTTHRHLSPLVGLFPGDRIAPDTSPPTLVTGATNLLTARGMQSFGWACAWRALSWARLRNADKAYQLLLAVLKPSVNSSNGAAINLLDMYDLGSSSVFQIDANFGTPSAMIEMLVHSRPGLLDLLPALPAAWAASGSVTGVGARGALTVDFAWTAGAVTTVTLHGPVGATTTVRGNGWSSTVTIPAGGSITFTPSANTLPSRCQLVNRASGKVIDVPGSATTTGTALIQYAAHGSDNQKWDLRTAGSGLWQLVNLHSGLAMDVQGGSTAPGSPIIQWTPTTATNQQWRLTDAGGGYVKITSVRSGLVLGVAGGSTADLAAVQQQTDTGSASQQWLVQPA
ncbi:glycosyl hydrolase family 95 catalytic domain-containing protein [Kitasatospora azatica]|uniref:glycosyl hydrolase family 95 catalytic domain-containing protein n=1 Tax=Kitasatospora azatica TaxID=58347 RepID=UPI000691BBC7|nr:glycoside hydrolase N-terminal domain-containing protein [Kitasatospora azatica]